MVMPNNLICLLIYLCGTCKASQIIILLVSHPPLLIFFLRAGGNNYSLFDIVAF